MVKISVKNGAIEAYVKSLERILKDYGKRVGAGKKAAGKRSLVLYKLVQKGFDLNGMLQTLYMN